MSNLNRKARTRTLIQLGGLIEKAGLTTLFDIELGTDLQLESNESTKAAQLLGLLLESKANLENHVEEKLKHWNKAGLLTLKNVV